MYVSATRVVCVNAMQVSQETSFCPVDYGGYFDYYHTGTLFIGAFNDLTDCLTTVTVFAAGKQQAIDLSLIFS